MDDDAETIPDAESAPDAETAPPTREALDPAAISPERFEPEADGGKLVHAEHLARYLWAADLAEGRAVLDAGCGTGYGSLVLAQAGARSLVAIDVSTEAVALTEGRLGGRGEVKRADTRELPFADKSFDLIVCFEVIEHVEGADRVLAEFARTLRSDGVLLISSPNPRIYLQGNPHHVHEFVPEELQAALKQHFAHVTLAAQHAWLGSSIAGVEQTRQLQDAEKNPISAVLSGPDADGEGTYVLAAAGHEKAQLPAPRLVIGGGFEVKWWLEQIANAEEQVDNAQTGTDDAIRERAIVEARAQETDARLAELEARLFEVEQDRARLLSERPQLEQAVADLARARAVMVDLQESISWKLTTPLRSGKQIARRARRPRR